MEIKCFTFNPIQENGYLLYEKGAEGVLIDPGCYSASEQKELSAFISDNNITLKYLLNTHCHIDHVLGNAYVHRTYGLKPLTHELEAKPLALVESYAPIFGLPHYEVSPAAERFISETDTIVLNGTTLEILFTPGHSVGSISFLDRSTNNLFSGDVLFSGSIGRTDLPGGDFETLKQSILTQLYTLSPSTVVHSGHGPTTTIGHEMAHNPYVKKA